MGRFPPDIQDFAGTFATLQTKRHDADYDPYLRLTKSQVEVDIAMASSAIEAFERQAKKDRRAFATHVILKKRE